MGNKKQTKKHGWLWWVLVVLWWLYIGWWWRPLLWLIRKGMNKTATKSDAKPSVAAGQQASVQTESAGSSATQTAKIERHKVAGISYRTSDLLTLGTVNSDYDLSKSELIEEGMTEERIYRIDFFVKRCELVPEPENPEDPNAIKVMADGVHIGYIKAGSCAHVHKLLREDRIQAVQCEIGGGKYKIVLEDYDEFGESTARIENDTIPYFAVVSITQKP